MSPLLASTLSHLRALVAFDTRNPPRAIDEGGIFAYLRDQLAGFECTTTDHGAGAVSLLAIRGKPTLLFNVHLDTVPDSPHWSASPFELRVDGDRAVGLGACDIKGAAAAFVAAANATQGDCAFLFTSDEEANDARCIAGFLSAFPRIANRESRIPAFDSVIVAEPTRCEAVLAHRGISSVLMRFAGRAGHASGEQSVADSALHQAVRWSARALDHVDSLARTRFGGLTGLRFNIGRIEGGIKANVIAPTAELRFGFRPLPSMDNGELLATFRSFAEPAAVEFTETFHGGSLPSGDVAEAEARRLAARDLADALDIPIGNAVDFWTEAALFSQAGYTTLVYGPGDIAQAHTADEWVALEQLQRYAESIRGIVEQGGRGLPLLDSRAQEGTHE
ncbi:acetylornithine deacetylase [Dokdonella sp.]|uniref:acetylornithine deacetylase n=1 Tax=Dokdonella sp. TaxID=2291710 RepID=UPI001B2F13FF|nr:acetylornithine deacetylase [Dokdonella sp.]MBO9662729.1 acetylornithine deacetylase [Dokdonella sp.]